MSQDERTDGMRADPLAQLFERTAVGGRQRFNATYLRGFRLMRNGIFPNVLVSRDTNQSVADATVVQMNLDTINNDAWSDEHGAVADSLVAVVASNQLVVRLEGIFSIYCMHQWAYDTGGGFRQMRLLLNGLEVDRDVITQPIDATWIPPATNHVGIQAVRLSDGDTVKCDLFQTTGGALNGVAPASIGMTWGGL